MRSSLHLGIAVAISCAAASGVPAAGAKDARHGGVSQTLSVLAPPTASQSRASGELTAAVTGATYGTSKNFAGDRASVPLTAGTAYRANRAVGSLAYGFSGALTAFADLSYVTSMVDTARISISESKLGDTDVGLRFGSEFGRFRVMAEAGALIPAYSRASTAEWSRLTAASALPPGNGIHEYWGLAAAEAPLAGDFFLGLGAGAAYRAAGFSNPLRFAGYLKYERWREFFVKAGVFAETPLTEDEFAGSTAPVAERASTVLGGSSALNSIDPAFMKLDTSAGVYVNHCVFLSAGFQTELTGRNTSQGTFFLASLGYHFGGPAAVPSYGPKTEADREGSRGFRQYYFSATVTKVNRSQGLFLIDKGATSGVQAGETLDVFAPDPNGETLGETVGRAKVIEAGPTRSKLKITETFGTESGGAEIKEGFVVRRPLH